MSPMDVALVAAFCVAFVALWLTLVVLTVRQIRDRYRGRDDTVLTLWTIAVIIWPICGSAAWLVWSGWSARSATSSPRQTPASLR